MKLLVMLFASASCYFLSFSPKCITQGPIDEEFSPYFFFFIMKDQLSHSYSITDNVIFLCSVMFFILNSILLRRNILDLLVAGVLSKTSCMYS